MKTATLAIISALFTMSSALEKPRYLRPQHWARQISNLSSSTTTSSFLTTVSSAADENPQTTFGAAAAAIESAIAQVLSATAPNKTTLPVQPTTTTSPVQTTTPTTSTADQTLTTISTTSVLVPTVAPTTPIGASVGSGGTTSVSGTLYTTTVVAAYETVVSQATTLTENGIAYVASYAGETLTITNCPCTRSAVVVVATTTICASCVTAADGAIVQASATANEAASVATVAGEAVVFTGAAPANTIGRVKVSGVVAISIVVVTIASAMMW